MNSTPSTEQLIRKAKSAWLRDDEFWGGGLIAIQALEHFKREVTRGRIPANDALKILEDTNRRGEFVADVHARRVAVVSEYDRVVQTIEKAVGVIERLEAAHKRAEKDKAEQEGRIRDVFKMVGQVTTDIKTYDDHLRSIKQNTSLKYAIGLTIALNLGVTVLGQFVNFPELWKKLHKEPTHNTQVLPPNNDNRKPVDPVRPLIVPAPQPKAQTVAPVS